jgi:hypothetical protein
MAHADHLQGPQSRITRKHTGYGAGVQGPVAVPIREGGQEVGHAKVCQQGAQGVQAFHQDVGRAQVAVQDAQGVQVCQASDRLPQQPKDGCQGGPTLRTGKTGKTGAGDTGFQKLKKWSARHHTQTHTHTHKHTHRAHATQHNIRKSDDGTRTKNS